MAKAAPKRKPRGGGKKGPPAINRPFNLNERQWRFVVAYVAKPNATLAAKLVGYSEKTAHAIGSENLHKPAIKAAIDHLTAKRAQRHEITADKVLQTLALIAFTPDEEMPDRKRGEQMKALDLLGRYLHLWDPKGGAMEKPPDAGPDDPRDKLLKMMADMARREAIDVRAEVLEDASAPIQREDGR